MFGGETGGQGAAGLNTLLSGLGAYQSFQRGQAFPGVMQSIGAAGSGARMLGAGQTAGGIGGIGSLAGLGYDLSQGRFGSQTLAQGISGAGQIAGGLGYNALAGTLGSAAGGASALGTLASSIHGLAGGDDRSLGRGIGGIGGVAAGAAIGSVVPGIGTLIGAGLGGVLGSSLGGLFGQKVPHYEAVRAHAAGVGKEGAGRYAQGISQAASSGNIGAVQKALGQSFADSHIRADFNLPPDMAKALGTSPNVDIANLSPEKFGQFLKAWKDHRELADDWVQGSGDVPYLKQADAQNLAAQSKGMAEKTLDALVQQYGPELDKIDSPIAPPSQEAVTAARGRKAQGYIGDVQKLVAQGVPGYNHDNVSSTIMKNYHMSKEDADKLASQAVPAPTGFGGGYAGPVNQYEQMSQNR